MNAWFVSDIHIVDESDSRGLKFVEFLIGLNSENCTHLFLMGDIFDLWLSNHLYFIQKFPKTLYELGRLQKQGIEIHYFEGNHDLYLKDYFTDEMGLSVHGGPETFLLGRWKVRVEHGDQIDSSDKGYRFLRWLLRTPVLVFLAQHLPGYLVAAFGNFLSRRSRTYTSTVKTITAQRTIDVLRSYAQTYSKQNLVDLILSGHLHERDDFNFTMDSRKVRAVNLGTWLKKPVAFHITDSSHGFVEL